MKRFWDGVGVERRPEGYAVLLDGRPVRLPGGGSLVLGEPRLAEAVAAEWAAAGGGRRDGAWSFEDLPLTRLAGTAAERIAPDPAPTVAALAAYGTADLLCYRDADPALAARQAAAWEPWLDWAARDLGATLRVTEGVMPVPQDPAATAALARAVAARPPLALAALGIAVPALGSLVLGLAMARGVLGAAEAHRLASLDEILQAERWGEDDEAVARRARLAADVALAGRLLALAEDAAAEAGA